jgi:HD-GYP domain-containing protein (c-di-GMP phosphodiesterase class II)
MATSDYKNHARPKLLQAFLYRAAQHSKPAVAGLTRGFVVSELLVEERRGIQQGLHALTTSAAKRLEARGNGNKWTYTRRHSTEVAFLSYVMAAQAKRHAAYADTPDPGLVFIGGMLHDIGKTLLPMSLIVKELGVTVLNFRLFEGMQMSDVERTVLRDEHLSAGTQYVRMFDADGNMNVVLDMVGLHHVMYNGMDSLVPSYPTHLAGMNLSPAANIAKAADFLSAVQPRHYRAESWVRNTQGALAYALAVSGMEIDPVAVACLITGTHKIGMKEAVGLTSKFKHPDGQGGISSRQGVKEYVQRCVENSQEFTDLAALWDAGKVEGYESETANLAKRHGFPTISDVSSITTLEHVANA